MMLRSSLLSQISGLRHAFLSTPDPTPPSMISLRQVHGATLVPVSTKITIELGEGDGLVGSGPQPNPLGVRTADCVPLLFATRATLRSGAPPIIAAVHAGWRGVIAGIAPKAVEWMLGHGATHEEIFIAAGPCIRSCCFEVQSDVLHQFEAHFGSTVTAAGSCCTSTGTSLNLIYFIESQFKTLGIPRSHFETVGPCTCCGPEDLASFRADGPRAGRQWSWIARP